MSNRLIGCALIKYGKEKQRQCKRDAYNSEMREVVVLDDGLAVDGEPALGGPREQEEQVDTARAHGMRVKSQVNKQQARV